MKDKITLDQKLHKRKIKKPNFIYNVLGFVWKVVIAKKYNVHVKSKVNLKKVKEPFIMISNHASRLDYMFTGIPMLPKRMNFVAGYNEFFRSHLQGVFKILRVIPKKNFTADIYTIKEIKRVVKAGGNIMIFPEGMSSIGGSNQPVAIGTGKLIKHLGIPVYYSVIKGGYLTSPKYELTDRLGYIEVEIDKLFEPNDIKELTPEEIEQKINKAIKHDDYEWNLKEKHIYKTKAEIAKNLHDLLFYCPKCKCEFTMVGEQNKIYCTKCGNGATIDNTYKMTPFNDECVIPKTQTEWFNLEREVVKEQLKNKDFKLIEEVELGILPKYDYLKDQKTSEIVGKGTITLDFNGLTYNGTKNNEEFSFHINSSELPTYGMCTDLSRFYTFIDGEFVEFYPKNRTVEKWFMATEEIHRINNGKWQDIK